MTNASQVYLAISSVTLRGPDGEVSYDVTPEGEDFLAIRQEGDWNDVQADQMQPGLPHLYYIVEYE